MLPLKALLRLYRAHPWLLLMSLAGLMLGVTLVVAIELLNHSARTNFVAARSQLAGEANYRLAPSGGLDEGLYVRLVRSQPALDAMPQLHAWLKDEQGRSFQLLGMDLFNPGPLRRLFGEQPGREPDFTLSRADSVWLSAPEAKRLGWSPGQSRSFMLGGGEADSARTLTLTLAGTFEPGAVPMERLLVTDIGLAQPLLGNAGRLDRIVFKLSDEEANALQRALQTYYPHQPLWLEPISPALDASQLGDALALNLSALSLLAMAVGLFLVFNAQRFVQSVRRPQLAQLIILGMPPSRVLRYLALELLILATIGTLLGLLLGSLLALTLMGQLTQALADLYGPNPIDLLRLSPASLIKALLIGLLGTLAANLPGWWQLLRQSPLELREGSSRPPVHPWRRRLLAIAILLLCALCLLLPQTGLGGALFVAGGWLLAMALALPDALRALLGRLRGHGPLSVRIGVAETQYHLDRTAIAVMALQLAIAAAIGIGVMVSSFRSSVEIWLGQRLAADLYVSAPRGGGSRGQLSEQTLTAILAEPQVSAASRRAVLPARWQGQPIEWAQMDFIPELKAAYPLLAGRWPAAPDEVLASEPLTVRLGVKVGQTLDVTSEGGPRALTVTGVYQDYGSDKGQILHAFEGGKVQSLALFSTDPEGLCDRLRARFGERVNLLPAPAIHAAALKVFDQTFVVTELLKLLILGIAFVGIGSAFMVLGLARRGELQTLQSLGIGPRHCRRLLVWQGAGLGLLTALLALPVGYGLAWVLIEVVNPRAFGWRLAFEAAPLHAVTALLLAPLCGALASWYAARRVV
ncbi:FtsX-like permease family protein [Aeromonas rivipollensis]